MEKQQKWKAGRIKSKISISSTIHAAFGWLMLLWDKKNGRKSKTNHTHSLTCDAEHENVKEPKKCGIKIQLVVSSGYYGAGVLGWPGAGFGERWLQLLLLLLLLLSATLVWLFQCFCMLISEQITVNKTKFEMCVSVVFVFFLRFASVSCLVVGVVVEEGGYTGKISSSSTVLR